MTDSRTISGGTTGGGSLPQSKPKNGHKPDASLAEFASFHEGYVRHYIALADTKAGVVLGFVSAFVAFLFSKQVFHRLLFGGQCDWSAWLAWVSTLLLVGSGALAAWVIAPRMKSTGEGLVFFGSVRAHADAEAYSHAVKSSGAELLINARLRHSYDVSTVCWRKYHNLRLAIWLGVSGLMASLPLLGMI